MTLALPRSVPLPFVTTSVLTDLRVGLLLLPVWWLLGVDQFVWPILSGLLLVKAVVRDRSLAVPKLFALGLLALLLAVLLAAPQVSGERWLTYARNVYVAVGGACAALLVAATHRTWTDVRGTIVTIAFVTTLISLAGALGSLGVRGEFASLTARFLGPGSASAYLGAMTIKSLVHAEASWFAPGFLRPRGLMLYPNLLAGAAAIAIVTKVALARDASGFVRFAAYSLVVVDLGVMVATLSRSGWLALGAAGAVVLLAWPTTYLSAAGRAAAIAGFTVMLVVSGAGTIVSDRLFEKGHSNQTRFETYALTLDAVISEPRTLLFGHGTQRDSTEIVIPMGSHSTYLGMLFKYGIVGFAAFMAVLLGAARAAFAALARARGDTRLTIVPVAGMLTIIIVQGLFIEVDVDATYAMLFWMNVGLAAAVSRARPDSTQPKGQPA